jgi:H+/Cl- antiporter ClcA
MIRGDTIVGAIGGLATGYVLWLVAFSIGYDTTTVSRWAPLVLLAAVVLGLCAGVCGWWLRRRLKYPWSAFTLGLPVLPVALTLAVLADLYL